MGKLLLLPLPLTFSLYFIGNHLSFPFLVLWFISIFVVAYFISNVIHEIAHYVFFRYYRLTITELSFGVFRIIFIDGRSVILWTFDRPFDALCSCKGLREIGNQRRSICLLAGGMANLVATVILVILCLFVTIQQVKLLLFVQISACISNAFVNIVLPHSTDRKMLCQLNKQDKLEK